MRIRTTLTTLALALGVAGCGDDGDGSGDGAASQEAVVEETLRTSFTTDDPDNCTRRITAQLLRRTYGTVEECRTATARDLNARSVEFTRLRVSGPRAAVTVAVTGSELDGQDFDARLRRIDGDWRLDAIGLPTSDRANLRRGLIDGLRAEKLGASVQRCVLRRLTPAIRRTEITDLGDGTDLPAALTRRLDAAVEACIS